MSTHALTPYDYHEIVDAVASGTLPKLLSEHTAPSSLTRFYVRMPDPKFDVVVQTAGPIGSQSFKVFPASYWMNGNTIESADSITAAYAQLDHLMQNFAKTTQQPDNQNPQPPADEADDEEFFTYHAQLMGNTARTNTHRANVMQQYAHGLRGVAQLLRAQAHNIAHPEMVNATIEHIDTIDHLLLEQAGESLMMADRFQAAGMKNLDMAENRDLADSPEMDAALADFQKTHQSYNVASLTRIDELKTEHDYLANIVHSMSRQPNETEFDQELQSAIHALESQACIPARIKNQPGTVSPSYPHQLGLVLEGVSRWNLTAPPAKDPEKIWAVRVERHVKGPTEAER